MSIDIIVPDIGDDKFPIIEILVAKGDDVAEEDGIVLLESDKATMEVPAPKDGVIIGLTVNVGDEVGAGDVIGTMNSDSQATSTTEEKTTDDVNNKEVVNQEKTEKEEKTSILPTPNLETINNIDETSFRTAHASPSVRKLARELSADLGKIQGTGRKNRITEDDVKKFTKAIVSGPGIKAGGAGGNIGIAAIPSQDFSKFGSIEEHKLSKINVLTGEHMTRCWLNIPHVTQNDEVDITEMALFRKSLKLEAEKLGVRVTMLSFLMKAVVSGMKALPKFNSSLSPDGQSLIMKNYFNIGIAVDTPNGLIVPVIQNVAQKSIYDLSRDLMTMSKKARDGKLTPADMSGGCMTISSLGGIGGTSFTPIVNAPEVAILGISRSRMQPVWNGNEFEPRNILPISLSYDHRVIDGADGARFTQHLAEMLSDARRMLL